MSHFDVLSRHTEIKGLRVLEASAGTGKTFAIEHLVARLLLETQVTIDQILVVTFTRAAARELKQRIYSNLERSLDMLKTGLPGPDYIRLWQEDRENEIKNAIRKLEEALRCFDCSQIFTIHSFCYRMLRELPFESGMVSLNKENDSIEASVLLKKIILDFLRDKLSSSSYGISQIKILLNLYVRDFDELLRKLIDLVYSLQTSSQIDSSSSKTQGDFESSFFQFQAALKTLYQSKSIVSSSLYEDYEKLSACYRGMGRSNYAAGVLTLAKLIEKRECTLAEFNELIEASLGFLQEMRADNLKVRAVFPKTLVYPGIFDEIKASFYPIIRNVQDPQRILLRMAQELQTYLSWQDFREENLTPDEILKKMESALEKAPFVEGVKKRFRAAIVDEFQDTDPIQWGIFRKLFLETKQTVVAVYLVGDPKQSIYSFRNADLYTYLEAVEIIGAQGRSFLSINYRSEPYLVHALNTLFSTHWIKLPKIGTHLPYLPVKSREGVLLNWIEDGRGSVHFFIASQKLLKERRWPTSLTEENYILPFIAQEIRQLCHVHQLRYEQIAILVKDRYQARRLDLFFKKMKIPVNVKRDHPLSSTAAFLALKQLFELLLDPSDLSKLKIVLAGPLLMKDVSILKKGGEVEEVMLARRAFFELRSCFQKDGLACFIQAFLEMKIGDEKHSIFEKMAIFQPSSLIFNLRQLIELLLEQECKKKNSIQDCFLFLQQLSKIDSKQDENLKAHSPEEGGVEILTTHMSKGLEYQVVFALGIASRQMKIAEEDDGDEKGNEEIEARIDSGEREAEKLRQLYVALTRAKSRVYIPFICCEDKKEGLDEKAEPSPLELLFSCLKQDFNGQITEVSEILDQLKTNASFSYSYLEQDHQRCSDPVELEEIFPRDGVVDNSQATIIQRSELSIEKLNLLAMPADFPFPFKRESLVSFSSLAKKGERPFFSAPTFMQNALDLPLGEQTGSILHQIFEQIFKRKLLNFKKSHSEMEQLEKLVSYQIIGTPLENFQKLIVAMVQEVFDLQLIDSFTLSELSPHSFQQEMEFLFYQNSFAFKGFIDLVFEKDGLYYIVDWKSNWLGSREEDYSYEKIEEAMIKNDYFFQAAIYAKALELYVKLFDIRPFKECFGGALYLFFRGKKVYHFFPEPLDLFQKSAKIIPKIDEALILKEVY